MIGKTISHYKILEKLGIGGMGVVYKAEDTKLKRIVALKFLPPELTCDPELKNRFIHEAQAASVFQHSNICTIHDIDETEESQLFIVMDCYDGETLKKKVDSGQLAVDSAIDIAIQIVQGLAKAHEHGIVHRDIKPANVMITKDGVAKILNFGLAKLAGQIGITKAGTTLGTTAYMSPEQVRGEDVVHRTDIWSLGVVLYEMLTGQLPFRGDYEQAVMYAILNEQPQPIQKIIPEISSVLIHLLDRMLEKDVSLRYQTISEVLIELKHLKSTGVDSSSSHRSQQAIHVPSANKIKNRKKLFFPSIVAILMITASVLFILLNPFSKSGPSESMKIIPFTSLPGMEIHPAISPDGREIAFVWNGGQGYYGNIYVQIIGTLEPQKLTNDAGADICPVWTPDGRFILFGRFKLYSEKTIIGSVQLIKMPARGDGKNTFYSRKCFSESNS